MLGVGVLFFPANITSVCQGFKDLVHLRVEGEHKRVGRKFEFD